MNRFRNTYHQNAADTRIDETTENGNKPFLMNGTKAEAK